MLMTGEDYRESLRRLKPRVFVNSEQIESVADHPSLAPGINAMAITYDYAQDERYRHLMTATEESSGKLSSTSPSQLSSRPLQSSSGRSW